jgi:hypothetical protein
MQIGIAPTDGYQLIEGKWVKGITQGCNNVTQSGITATGTSSQATAAPIPPRVHLVEVDTCPANAGVYLPPAQSGIEILLYNNTAATLTVYPNIKNNASGVQDTINNTTSISVNAHTAEIFFCAKDGIWAAK